MNYWKNWISSLVTWILIQTVIGILIFFFSKGLESEFPKTTFIIIQGNSHFIGFSSLIFGTLLYRIFSERIKSEKLHYFLTLASTGVVAILAGLICIIVYSQLIDILSLPKPKPFEYVTGLLLPAFILGISISILVLKFEIRKSNQVLQKVVREPSEIDKDKTSRYGLAVQQGARYTIVSYPDIIYIQARAKKSVVHTEKEQFVSAKLLRKFLPSLPSKIFLRIHRSYIVNLEWIREIEYDIGGSYIVKLKDEDETVLPISREIAQELKKNLGIKGSKD